jgi:predicted phage baseplate assembly protein
MSHATADAGSGGTAMTAPPAFDALPVTAANRTALPRIDYAADDLASLQARLLARLPAALPGWNPALAAGEGGDYAAAFTTLFAQLAAILSAYADQRANESFLRTARSHRSLIDLCALIDYRLGAGASATALQAFHAKPGQAGVLPAGFRLQAAPPPGAKGRTELVFETLAALDVHASRNQMRLAGHDRSGRVLRLRSLAGAPQDVEALLDAAYPGLKAGLPLVLDAGSSLTALLLAAADEPQPGATRIRWGAGGAGADRDLPIADLVLLARPRQAMRLAAAERADELTLGQHVLPVASAAPFSVGGAVLVASGGFLMPAQVLARSTAAGAASLSLSRGLTASLRRSATRVLAGTARGHVAGTLRAGTTQLPRSSYASANGFTSVPNPGDLLLLADAAGVELATVGSVSATVVTLAQPLLRALRPFTLPGDTAARVHFYSVAPDDPATPQSLLRPVLLQDLPGVLAGGQTVLTLDKACDGLTPQTVVALADGVQAGALRVLAAESVEGRTRLTLAGSAAGTLRVATLALHGPFEHRMRVAGHHRAEATLPAGTAQLDIAGAPIGLAPGLDLVVADLQHAEGARIVQVLPQAGFTRLSLARPLQHPYALGDAQVLGNVATVTHGATLPQEVLGSGDPAAAPQRFALRRTPMAFVPDPAAPRGVAPALQVWVDGERWSAVDTLAGSGPLDRHYEIEFDDAGFAAVVFGDGVHGAAPPSGRNNIVARYRSGHGTAANVAAQAIRTMPQPAPFLERSSNPVAAGGGAERESVSDARRQAAHRVRTLDRAVSLADHADLALTFSGIAKARADLEREGQGAAARRVVVITCAAAGGHPLSLPQHEALLAFLAARSCEPARLRVRSHRAWPVRLALRVQLLPGFAQAAVQRALLAAFGALPPEGEAGSAGFFAFERRDLGAGLVLSDVYALAEATAGVDHVLATLFHAEGQAAQVADRIDVPADALATGGSAADASIGRLTLQLIGGLA